MNILKKSLFPSCFLLTAALLISCGGPEKPAAVPSDTTAVNENTPAGNGEAVNELADFKFHYLIGNIPSPMEIVDALPQAGVAFNKSVLNPVENESKYHTSLQKAINFGVYSVDMTYLASHEEFGTVKAYMSATRNLAKSLDLTETFDRVVGSRMNKEGENKDTIRKVIDEAYYEVDSYMRTNERALAATQMLTGSWIESQYITLSLIKDMQVNEKNKLLFDKVFEQKRHLESLVSLLKEYETDKSFKPVISRFYTLNESYKKMKTEDATNNAFLAKLAEEVSDLRNELVK